MENIKRIINEGVKLSLYCDNNEIQPIVDEFFMEFKKYKSQYDKERLATFIIENMDECCDNIFIENIIKNKKIINIFIQINNKLVDNLQYDGKDVGCHVKHLNSDKVFKVVKRIIDVVKTQKSSINNFYTNIIENDYQLPSLFDKEGNNYLTSECIEMSKYELRKYKINQILN